MRAIPLVAGAPVRAVLHVERPQPHYLSWPDLEVDLHVKSISHPEKYPLVSRPSASRDAAAEERWARQGRVW